MLPAMVVMIMILIYNLADTFFIGKTDDALMVAAVLFGATVKRRQAESVTSTV